MAAKRLTMTTLLCLLAGCATSQPVTRIALLAPFEGRYREVGYDLYYAAKLALNDGGYTNIELLPIDDGGTVEYAAERAEALSLNPLVQVALVAGIEASDERVQQAFGDVPVIVIGHWSTEPQDSDIFMLSNVEIDSMVTDEVDIIDAAQLESPVIGREVLALKQFPRLRETLEEITVVSSASPADAAFTERYLNSDLFVQPPGLLVTLGYDATRIAADAVVNAVDRQGVTVNLEQMNYSGLNGLIAFENSYWLDAPIIYYTYDEDGQLNPQE